ncbi:hypothetical protein GE09DRAFT_1056730 [Coniochaeta sp. 2T2.1]|nr:hypothetical protein GE09DRAFT_1056730 [Coniochaeta sp. 2T2.1]
MRSQCITAALAISFSLAGAAVLEFPSESYGAESYGAESYGSDFYGSESYGEDSYGADSYGSAEDEESAESYGADSYGADSYGADSHGADFYGADSYGADSYGADSYGADSYGADSYGAESHDEESYGADSYGAESYGADSYGSESPHEGPWPWSLAPLAQSKETNDWNTMVLADITGDRIYLNGEMLNANGSTVNQKLALSPDATCGVLVNNSQVALLNSNLSKPAYTGQAHLTSMYDSAAVCVTNQSYFTFGYGLITTTGPGEVAVYASGENTTAHLSAAVVENKDTDFSFGLVANDQAAISASFIEYSSNSTGTCAFVADGGYITVSESTAVLRGPESAVFCSLGSGDALSEIHAQDVSAYSENGPIAALYGNTYLAAFTNSTLYSGGRAAIISSTIGAGALSDTVLHATSSQIEAMNPDAPVLLFTLKDIDATFYHTELIPSASNVLLHAACDDSAAEGDCNHFRDPAYLTWKLSHVTTWTGAVTSNTTTGIYGASPVDIRIDLTSRWNVTKESWVQSLSTAMDDLQSVSVAEPGIVVHYNASHVLNKYLQGKTIELQGGGLAQPY